jgi:hypothetical protein
VGVLGEKVGSGIAMDYEPYCAGIAAVTHPPYKKNPPERPVGGPFFWCEIEKGAFSAEKLGDE